MSNNVLPAIRFTDVAGMLPTIRIQHFHGGCLVTSGRCGDPIAMDGWHRLSEDHQDLFLNYYDLHKCINVDAEDETEAERVTRLAEVHLFEIAYNK